MKIKNVLIIQKNIPHYRIDFFNSLSKYNGINLNVYSLNNEKLLSSDITKYDFKFKKISRIKFLMFSYYLFKIPKNFKKDDVVIVVGNIRHIHNYILFLFCKIKKIKIFWWGIWNMPGRDNLISKIRKKIASLFDHIIVYSDIEKNNALEDLIDFRKISSFNNSIKVNYNYSKKIKKNLIFKLLYVGRLTKKPKLELAIKAIYNLNIKNYKIRLNIVGDGPEKNKLKKLVKDYKLQNFIFLHGAIYDERDLKKFFLNSDFFIYPGAIGLSIFHSFGYGLPVITHDDNKNQAPEFYLFKNKFNGISFKNNDIEDLIDKIEIIINNYNDYIYLKDNALKTVYEDFTFEDSVKNFKNSILQF